MRRVIGVFCLLLLGTAAFAEGMEMVIAPPTAAQSGRTLHNTGEEAVSVPLSNRLSCRNESDRKIIDLPAPSSAGRANTSQEHVTLESLFTLYQPYLVNFSGYEPMYFLVGTDPEKSKFQISFKHRLLNPAGGLATDYPWLKGLHFGYTQTSFWDLKTESAPFDDTSYKPELFFITPNLKLRPSWVKGFFFQAGLQHESNGRGGSESRTTNLLYVKPIFIFYNPHTHYGLQIAPKIWSYVGNDDLSNPDLKDYRGYFELDMKVGIANGFVLGSYFRWGREGASIQLDLSYPIRQLLLQNVDFYFHAQYENALAESLLRFRERTEALRLGFSIVR